MWADVAKTRRISSRRLLNVAEKKLFLKSVNNY